MQFNTGKQFDELVENDLLANVDAQAAAQNWKAILPAAFVQAVTRNGQMLRGAGQHPRPELAVLLQRRAGQAPASQPPTNWDDLFAALDKLKAAGLIPLAFSGQKNWERNLFNAVLVGQRRPRHVRRVLGQARRRHGEEPRVQDVAETYKRLRGYVDPGSPGRNWNDATSLVIQGKAGMQFMGDWAKGEFTAAGLTPGKDYGCTVLGDHGMAYVMGGDVFAFPKPEGPGQDQGAAVARPGAAGARHADRVQAEEGLDPGAARCRYQLARRLRAQGGRLDRRQERAGAGATRCCRRPRSPARSRTSSRSTGTTPAMTTDAFVAQGREHD